MLFAQRLEEVAAFYANVLGLNEAGRADDHILLESPGFQLVVHRTSRDSADAQSRTRRAGAAFKPVFFVPSLAIARTLAAAHGGSMEPPAQEWSFNGVAVCDAMDPEGNVLQFRESHTPSQ